MEFSKAARDINQQIAVLMISVLEVYLRDCYAGIMNTKFVNANSSLFEKFIEDCKNDFLNPGKASERYKKELGFDLKMSVGEDTFKRLVELAEYRNVIVHNNGICDARFIGQKAGKYKLHDTIDLSLGELHNFLQAVDNTSIIIDKEYSTIINKHIVDDLKYKLITEAPDLLAVYVPPRMKKPIILTTKNKNNQVIDN